MQTIFINIMYFTYGLVFCLFVYCLSQYIPDCLGTHNLPVWAPNWWTAFTWSSVHDHMWLRSLTFLKETGSLKKNPHMRKREGSWKPLLCTPRRKTTVHSSLPSRSPLQWRSLLGNHLTVLDQWSQPLQPSPQDRIVSIGPKRCQSGWCTVTL